MDERVLSRMDAPALREYIRTLLEKKDKPSKKQADESDDEREALSDLHEETKGKPSGVPVLKDDLPFDLGSDDEEEGESSDEEDSQASEPIPPKKKGTK